MPPYGYQGENMPYYAPQNPYYPTEMMTEEEYFMMKAAAGEELQPGKS
jgi:hypothetical protein